MQSCVETNSVVARNNYVAIVPTAPQLSSAEILTADSQNETIQPTAPQMSLAQNLLDDGQRCNDQPPDYEPPPDYRTVMI